MDDSWAKFIEVYKARLTIDLAILAGMVTLSGYAIANKQPAICLVAAGACLFGGFIDFMIVYHLATPFLYKAFISETDTDEPISRLFLAFGRDTSHKFEDVRKMRPGPHRQARFRRVYAFRSFGTKLTVFALGSLAEVLLWALLNRH